MTVGAQDFLANTAGNDTFTFEVDTTFSVNGSVINPYTGERLSVAGKNRSFDVYDGSDGTDTVNGTSGNDVFVQNTLGSSVEPGGGRATHYTNIEVINAQGGLDVVDLTHSGGAGGDYASITVYGGAGADVLWGGEGSDTFYGDTGAGTGLGSADRLNGGGGSDYLYGDGGADTIDGGAGYDNLYGGDGNDTLYQGAGGGNLYGDNGNDILVGGADGAYAYGGEGSDTYLWRPGDGDLNAYDYGSSGTDVFATTSTTLGGLGSFSGIEQIKEQNGNPFAIVGGSSGYYWDFTTTTLVNVSSIKGGAGSDTIYGTTSGDTFLNSGGDDYIHGGNSDDVLKCTSGTGGRTHFYGEAGSDTIEAQGATLDCLGDFAPSDSVETITRVGGAALTINATDGYWYWSRTWDFTATNLINVVEIKAGHYTDTVIDNDDGHILNGGDNDGYADTLTGNGGADHFAFTGNWGADTVTDFQDNVDKIDLSDLGGYAFGEISDYIKDNGTDTTIEFASNQKITLLGILANQLTENDFIL